MLREMYFAIAQSVRAVFPQTSTDDRIAVTQIRLDGLDGAYYRERLNMGASNPEASRTLKRRLARVVFHRLYIDHQNRSQPCQPAAA